jgi:serine/threonine-protein kinase
VSEPRPSAGALTIGVTVGNYRVERKLGEGGMGAVYLAEHPLLGRKAAVKVLLPEHSQRNDLVTRFFNEAKTAAGLRHPALVEVFDFGFLSDGSGYIVMEYLDGESLGARLARVAPLQAEAAAEIARQLAGGVGAAHAHAIVHRDLKPDNIYLVPDPEDPTRERVKILDFGIAKLVQPQQPGSKGATSTGMVLGTPLFMAPEQCRGAGQVDHRADIYSVGCILYMMLTGRPPFAYEGVGEILGAHLHEPVTPPRSLDAGIPAALEAIVLRALEKKADARYQTMAEMGAALQAFLSGGATVATTGANTSAAARAPTAPRSVANPATLAPTTFSSAAAEQGESGLPDESEVPIDRSSRRYLPLLAVVAGVAVAVIAFTTLRKRAPDPGASASATPESTPRAASAPAPAPAPVAAAPPTAAPPAPAAPPPAPAPAATAKAAPVEGEGARPEPHSARPGAGSKTAVKTSEPRERNRALYDKAIAYRARGEEAEALAAFRAYLRRDGLPAADRADAERQMILLQRKFGEIEVTCDLPGAEVAVDGQVYGRTPLSGPIFLMPGGHTLSLSKPGYKPISHNLRINAGERTPVRIELPR